jgi:hypothetical protein
MDHWFQKLDVLRAHCDAVGRDYDAIRKTIIGQVDPAEPDAFLREMEQYARLGVSHVQVAPSPEPVAFAAMLGENVIPRPSQISG